MSFDCNFTKFVDSGDTKILFVFASLITPISYLTETIFDVLRNSAKTC